MKEKTSWKKACEKLRKLPGAKIHKLDTPSLSDKSSYLESKGWEKVYHKGKLLGWLKNNQHSTALHSLEAALEIQNGLDIFFAGKMPHENTLPV